MSDAEPVWFMGPIRGPGYRFHVSIAPGRHERAALDRSGASSPHRPKGFPWPSMDRNGWGACHKPQGTTAMALTDQHKEAP